MSAPFRADEAARWCGARIVRGAGACVLSGVATDSRARCDGALFIALQGPRHDAHAHLAQALENGARALLVSRADAVPKGAREEVPVLLAPDTTRALGLLAAGHRAGFDGPVIAITGSNGKTTTKDMCAAIMSARAPTLATAGNLNNMYGVPLTLLAREAEHRALVIELGMNQRGEIAALANIVRPTIGVITNVGTAHLAGLGTRERIAREKGDLIAALDASGTALLNADDALLMQQAARTQARVLRFGLGEAARDAEFRASALQETETGYAFTLHAREETRVGRAHGRSAIARDESRAGEAHEVALECAGLSATTVQCALAAAGAALCAGATLADVAQGLAKYRPPAGRMTLRKLAGGVTLIDDSYNANPQSLETALRTLAARAPQNKSVAVLGDMGELGEESARAHEAAGALAAKLGIGALVALGAYAEHVARAARAHGLQHAQLAHTHEDAAARARKHFAPGAWVLVKGSRSMHMERVARALEGER